jgi:mannose-1-phosphate guanylyltransferase
MKAFLLAAGKGTRLKPYTDSKPKCLIPINGTPLLQIWIDLLARHGVTEVLINTHHHAGQVERFLADCRTRHTMKVLSVHEPQLLGSAGTILQNREVCRW